MNSYQEALSHISGGRVLDVATGRGQFVHTLIDNLSEYQEIIGIDQSEQNRQLFDQEFPNQRVEYRSMDAARLEFPDASFDTVCISNSLHHMPQLDQALLEMRRVLKPGGNWIIQEMYRDNQTESQMTHVLLHHWSAGMDRAKGIYHAETYTRQELVDLITGLGLRDTTFFDIRDLDENPHDPENTEYLDQRLAKSLEAWAGLPEEDTYRRSGEEIRQRLVTIGFNSATELLAVGKKP